MYESSTRVLLIEDDRADYQLLRRCLAGLPSACDLAWSSTLAEALSRLDTTNFDVVLTDLSLPDSQGIDAVRRVRDRNACVPIVVLTTSNDHNLEREALESGAQDYLNKSDATSRALEKAIHHAIQRQQQLVETKCMLAELKTSRAQLAEQRDLLESKNRRLKKLYRTAQRFVDNVSHEFRTPLTVIKDYVTLVREGMAGPINDEQTRMLDVATVRTDDLNNMVDDLLDVSKLEAGLLGVWRRNCRLSDALRTLIPAFEKKAEVKRISLTTDISEPLPEVYCDGEKIGRIVINLVTNAMKFCGEPGLVRLWAKENSDGCEVVVGVTDNGPGIDDEGLKAIFQRFKQLKSNIKSSTKGFGLGLNIAKELVDLNLGEMHVESRPGQGSTFSFSVPMAVPQEVMKRFLDRASAPSSSIGNITLVHGATRDAEPIGDADDLDSFFNYLLRRNDLLFRNGEHDWVFVLSTPQTEIDNFLDRAQAEYEKANRNRPYGPMPAFTFEVGGTWSVPDDCAEILEAFHQLTQRNLAYA
jgi:signal transduction histidine kinase